MSIFDHKDYKAAIQDRIRRNDSVYGYKTRLAAAAGCELSFLSRVLKSKEDLLPDHALGIARFWELPEDETEYFLELLQHSRARSKEMKSYCKARLERARETHLRRLRKMDLPELPRDALAAYCSSWHYIATYMSLQTPALNTRAALARKLGIPEETVAMALALLESLGVAARSGSGASETWRPLAGKGFQVPNDHPLKRVIISMLIQKGAQEALTHTGDDTLDYAAVYSGTIEDYREARRLLSEFIAKNNKIFRESRPEETLLMTLHFSPL